MGCYGIGVSRVLQTVIEYGCTHHQQQQQPLERVVWPEAIAPYHICIAPLTVAKVHLNTSSFLLRSWNDSEQTAVNTTHTECKMLGPRRPSSVAMDARHGPIYLSTCKAQRNYHFVLKFVAAKEGLCG